MSFMHRYCCCGGCIPSEDDCGFCSGTTPIRYIVTFSDVNFCGDPCYDADSISSIWVHANAFNGSHTLTQVSGSPCNWSVTYTNAIRLDFHNSVGCADGIASTSYLDATITLIQNGSVWNLRVVDSLGGVVFRDTQASSSSTDCTNLPSFANDGVVGDCRIDLGAGQFSDGYDGSATVVCDES